MEKKSWLALVGYPLLVACGDPWLLPLDAGPQRDAQGSDGGVAEGDAGFLVDAGVDDGGFDPQPACFPDENPPIPWECEPDVDWCDVVGDSGAASADLLATWSFIEGDDIVYQFRFSAMPFRDRNGQTVTLISTNPASSSINDRANAIESINPMSNLIGDLAIGISERTEGGGQWVFPPVQSDTALHYDSVLTPFDSCRWGLHPSAPIVQLRLPASILVRQSSTPKYVVHMTPCYGPASSTRCDVSWPSLAPAPVESKGGRADETAGVVSLCDAICPGSQR